MSTLCLVHYTLLLTSACWKSNNTNAQVMAFMLSLALDPTFGIHSHKTLDTAQPCHLLKPNVKPSSSHSISTPTNINTQIPSFWYNHCMHVCTRAHSCVCECVCVRAHFHIIPYVNCFGSCSTCIYQYPNTQFLLVIVCMCVCVCVCVCVHACVCVSI